MTPEEDRLTRQGLSLVLEHFDGNLAQRDQIVSDGLDAVREAEGGEEFPIADAIAYAAVVGVTMLSEVTQRSIEDSLTTLPIVEVRLLPQPAAVPWAAALTLVGAITQSYDTARAASREMDVPGAPNGLFSVAVSAWTQLAQATGRPAAEWLRIMLNSRRGQ